MPDPKQPISAEVLAEMRRMATINRRHETLLLLDALTASEQRAQAAESALDRAGRSRDAEALSRDQWRGRAVTAEAEVERLREACQRWKSLLGHEQREREDRAPLTPAESQARQDPYPTCLRCNGTGTCPIEGIPCPCTKACR